MMIAVEVPDEIYDDTSPVPMVCTADGEMLARAADLPAGAVTVTTVLGQTRTIRPYDYSPHLGSTVAGATQNATEPPRF
jgi:hypothetical protein